MARARTRKAYGHMHGVRRARRTDTDLLSRPEILQRGDSEPLCAGDPVKKGLLAKGVVVVG